MHKKIARNYILNYTCYFENQSIFKVLKSVLSCVIFTDYLIKMQHFYTCVAMHTEAKPNFRSLISNPNVWYI